MSQPRPFLGGLTAQQFLDQYWQKQPLLVRAAVPDTHTLLDAETLLGLACEEEVEARHVEFTQGSYQLHPGPFNEAELAALGERDWTLLVSDLEEHLPRLAPLLGNLDFLPSWRVDDIMASFAVPGGSVGPHFDSYDVFLLQVNGKRRWQVASQFDRGALDPNTDLCILRDFAPEAEWVLEPGDMLYLPPQIAHFGVALDACMTFSLGCRAPNRRELLEQLARDLLDDCEESAGYADPDLSPAKERHQLDAAALGRAWQEGQRALELDPPRAARSFAKLVTHPKALFAIDDFALPDADECEACLKGALEHAKGSRWLYLVGDPTRLYANGAEFECADASFARTLCETKHLPASLVTAWKRNEVREALLRDLVEHGVLVSAD